MSYILVQEAAGNLLHDELGWDVVYAYNREVLGENGTLGRKDYKEILLKRDLRAALQKFNPWITPAQITEAIGTLEQRLSTASLMQINEEKYFLLRDGIPVTVRRPDGRTEPKRAMVIDFQNPTENRFLAVKEMKIHGDLYRRRTDIVGFVNGLPLLFVELKNTTVDVQNAYTDNYTDYLDTIPHLFYYNAFLMLSNGVEAKVGTLGSKYEFFHEWKRLSEQEAGSVALETMLRGICKKENFLDLHNPEITDRILDAIEAADLDVDRQDKLEAEFAKEIHLLTAEPRLRSIARDFAGHYSDLWASGKAMFVCLNKVTCVRMYNYVQQYWQAEIEALEIQLKHATQQEAQELQRRIQWMRETEMAVVISQDQNEIQTFKKWGLDILPHRAKMEKRELDKEFKDRDNPLRVVFVCAMWLTGFDVKCLSCLYLDKPLKAHTLMQTIARANRVAEGKSNGLIIDYIGIVKALRKALANYTANTGGSSVDPTVDKEQLLERIRLVTEKARNFLEEQGFDLQTLIDATDFQKTALLLDACDAVCESIETKKTFTTMVSELVRLYKYTDRDDLTGDEKKQFDAITAIYAMLQKKRKHVDTTDLMVEINGIINDYVQIEPAEQGVTPSRQFDISGIDFDLLRREFAKVKRKNLAIRDLDLVIQQRIAALLFNNPNRINYYEQYQKIIEEYNSEQDRTAIEKVFQELMALVKDMTQEEQRYVREGFTSDEELSLYDMLFREDLSKSDIKKIKEVSVSLLTKVKEKISELDHWTDKQETKAVIDTLIRDTLWNELPECYDDLSISRYRQQIYEYVYTRYPEVA